MAINPVNNYIDIALIKNQNEIAVSLSDLLSIDELRAIDFSDIKKGVRNVEDIQHIYYAKDLGNNKILRIIDTLILDTFPATRYVSIRLSIDDKINIEYKCKYSKVIMKYMAAIFGRTYNYAKWKTDNDTKYIRSHILNNFSNKLAKLDDELLEELKFIIQYLIDDGSITNDNEFSYDFTIDKTMFHIESNNLGILRFQFKQNIERDWNILFTSKNTVGLSNINLIINQALNIVSQNIINNNA